MPIACILVKLLLKLNESDSKLGDDWSVATFMY